MPQSRHRKVKGRGSSSRSTHSKKKSNQKTLVIAVLVTLALAVAGSIFLFLNKGNDGGGGAPASGMVTTPSGLKYVDIAEGTGRAPTNGRMVSVHYTGTLENGAKFDSSFDRGKPIQFSLGTGSVIKGWDEGVMSMKVGGKRKLIIPPNLGYGPAGRPPKIPPNATLIFEVELVDAQ